jgi:micrococcal nuclease
VRPVRRSLPWILLVVLAAVYGYGRAGSGSDSGAGTARTGQVVKVVDGDTIRVRLGAGTERVRLIGIDTPETVKPDTPVQCYGRAASAEAHRLLDGRSVRLVGDAEARDRYGRLLAYVYRRPDGLFVNAELARRGFARQLTIPPNVRYADRFGALVAQARGAGRGLWGACG